MPEYVELVRSHGRDFAREVAAREGAAASFAADSSLQPLIASATGHLAAKLPEHVDAVHSYVDRALQLAPTMRASLERMTPEKFEGVLHPIFQEDELTLIVSGAFLGLVAGGIQQLVEEAHNRRRQAEAAEGKA